MRIRRFSEARGIFQEDEISFEPSIYCFGGPGDDGGDTSSTAASEDIGTKDVDKGPKGRDTSSDRQAYEDRFGGVSTRNFNMDTSQNFVDTDKGRVYGSTETLSKGMASGDISPSGDQATADFTAGIASSEPSIADVPEFDEPGGAVNLEEVLGYDPFGDFAATPVTQSVRGPAGVAGSNLDTSLIDSYLEGPMIADISTPMTGGAFVDQMRPPGDPQVGGIMADISAVDYGRAGQKDRAPGSMARDTSIEESLFGEPEYTTQDIFDRDPTGLGFETPQERISREQAEGSRAAAQAAAAQNATAEAQRRAQMAALGVDPADIALQERLDAQNALADQAVIESEADVQAMLDQMVADREVPEFDEPGGAVGPRTSAPESGSLMGDTIFGAPDVLGQDQDIGMGQSAAVPDIVGSVRGVPDATQQAADTALAATTGGYRDITDAQGNVIGIERSVNLGGGISQAELDAARAQGKAAQAGALDQRAKDQLERAAAAAAVAGERVVNGVPVTDLSVPAIDREPVFDPTVEVTDIPEDQQRPGLIESAAGIAKNLADLNADGEVSMMEGLAMLVPGVGPARALDSYLTSSKYGTDFGSQQTNMLSEQDRFAEDYDFGGGDDGGGDEVFQPIIPPLPEDIVDEAQTPEREPFQLGQYQYEPMAPVQYSYTGIPTLAPFVLRPSRTPRPIRPLYDFSGLGSLRRS